MILAYLMQVLVEFRPTKNMIDQMKMGCSYPIALSDYFDPLKFYTLPGIFFHIFHMPLLQFAYGHFFLTQGVAKWNYFAYMIPKAVSWSFGSVIVYYAEPPEKNLPDIFLTYTTARDMFSGALFYFSCKLMFELVTELKNEKNANVKKFRIISLIMSIGIYYFIYTIGNIWDLKSDDFNN